MTDVLLAEFSDAQSLIRAARRSHDAGHIPLDAFTPFPIEDLAPLLDRRPNPIRPAMLIAGLTTAALAYGLEWISAAALYPLNLGARPLNSWPVFVFMPFELAIFVAALTGVVAWLWATSLPRLHHALFAVPGFERATQDRFFLAVAAPAPDDRAADTDALLQDAGALSLQRVPI